MAEIPQPRRIGRFELLRELGRGAQGAVFLASDSRLGRQVALKTLRLDAHGDDTSSLVQMLLDEARMVSTLSHPNIVTLYDAGEERGSRYLVFEYVEGQTLAAAIREAGRLAVGRAVEIALALAQGVSCAHQRGIVHRDLKPANVMLTTGGVPRLMDFGIAQQGALDDALDEPIVGTPSYMAPEYITERSYTPASDVFALGVILYEMLTGAPPARGATPHETFSLIVKQTFRPPSTANRDVDERLDRVVMKSLAKNPAERFGSAIELAEALDAYLRPAPAPGVEGGGKQATLEFLLRRIRHKSDFPALSSTISAVNRVIGSDRESVGTLCNAILKDFALTNRLLKLVNAAHFNQFGGSISTVSRAVSILGFDAVRDVALSLLLFEHLHDRTNAAALKDQVVGAYLGGVVARELLATLGIREAEQAFICAMFHRLGKLLATFYLHEEAQAVARLVEARSHDEDRASAEVLGITFEELGIGVARAWNLPESIVRSMRSAKEAPRDPPVHEADRLRMLADLANELADVIGLAAEKERPAALAALARKYGRAAGVTDKSLAAAARASAVALLRDAPLLGISGGRGRMVEAARTWGANAPAPKPPTEVDTITLATALPDPADLPTQQLGAAQHPSPAARQAALAAGIQDITNALIGDIALNDLLRIILETMFRAIGFKRVLLFTLEPGRKELRCRFGFGSDVDAITQKGLSVPLDGSRNLFFAATSQGADLLIEDVSAPSIRPYVPAWYAERITARGMMLLPIVNNKRTVGLIYADADSSEQLRFSAEELNLLKALRNQAVLAMRQNS